MGMPKRYGTWEVIEFVARGGQGEVYRVRNVFDDKELVENLSTLPGVVRLLAKSTVRYPSEELGDIAHFISVLVVMRDLHCAWFLFSLCYPEFIRSDFFVDLPPTTGPD